jgi:hypothetical protein
MREGVMKYPNSWSTDTPGGVYGHVPEKLLSGKEQNFWSWDYTSQMPDYPDFQIIRQQIKGILLYI